MKVDSGFICDIVRQENNGKLIFIGVYSHDIVASHFPAQLSLHIVVCARFSSAGDIRIEVEATLDKVRLMAGELDVSIGAPGFSLIPLPLPLPALSGPGELKVRIRAKPGKWQDVRAITLKLAAHLNQAVNASNVP